MWAVTAPFLFGSVRYTVLVYFPGPDYMHYVQNPKLTRVAQAMRQFGMSRVLLTSVKRANYSESGLTARRVINTLASDEWFCDKYEVAFEYQGAMKYATPGSLTEYPIWNLDSDSSLDLKAMAENNGMVFIRNTVRNFNLATRSAPESMRRRLREMWEVVKRYGDAGTRQCKFIIYGYYQLQPLYCMGMSGGASDPDVYDNGYMVYEFDSGARKFSQEDAEIYSKNLLMPIEMASDVQCVNIRVFQGLPVYLKKFYDNIERVGDGGIFSQSIRQVDQFFEKQPWVSTMSTTYKKLRPHANIWATYGDMRTCDSCSVDYSCRYFKRGAVCALPGSEGRSLASMFGSRDSKDVIEGIGKVLEFQAMRFEEAAEAEFDARQRAKDAGEDPPPLDPEINKMANDLQKNAKQYATLLNPNLLKPQVQIGIAAGKVELSQPEVTPQLMAGAVRELEQAGYSRSEITPSMVYEHISTRDGVGRIVEGEIIDGVKRDF